MGVLNNFVVDANNPEIDGDQLSLSRFLKAWTFPSIFDVWNLLCIISTTILVVYVFLFALNRLRLHVASKTQNSRQVQYVAAIFKRKKRLSLTEGEGERQQQESLLPKTERKDNEYSIDSQFVRNSSSLYPDLRMATHNEPSEQSARTGMTVHTRITRNPEKRENTTAVEWSFRPQPYINALGQTKVFHVDVEINNKYIRVLIDTGASFSLISADVAGQLNIPKSKILPSTRSRLL